MEHHPTPWINIKHILSFNSDISELNNKISLGRFYEHIVMWKNIHYFHKDRRIQMYSMNWFGFNSGMFISTLYILSARVNDIDMIVSDIYICIV